MPSDLKFNDLVNDATGLEFYGQAVDLLVMVQADEVPHDPGIFTCRACDYEDQALGAAMPGIIATVADALIGKIPGVTIDSIAPDPEGEFQNGIAPVLIDWSLSS